MLAVLRLLLVPWVCCFLGMEAVLLRRKQHMRSADAATEGNVARWVKNLTWDDAYGNKTSDRVPVWSNLGTDPYLQDLMTRLRPQDVANVLEVGCGEGYDVKYLLEGGHKVTCIDVSHIVIDRLGKLYADASLIQGDIADDSSMGHTNFDGHFDLVFMRSVLYHLKPSQKIAALTRIHSWLKPGGYLLDLEYDPVRNAHLADLVNTDRDARAAVRVGPLFSLPTPKAQELLQHFFKVPSTDADPTECSWLSPVLKRRVYCARFELQK